MIEDYPRLAVPEHVVTGRSPLYLIGGWFSDNNYHGAAVAFSSHFRVIDEDGAILGEISDVYGASAIQGSFDENSLGFSKWYLGRGTERHIDFELIRRDDEFVGEYQNKFISSQGVVCCKIIKIIDDASTLVCTVYPR